MPPSSAPAAAAAEAAGVKCVIVGDAGVGKTSFVHAAMGDFGWRPGEPTRCDRGEVVVIDGVGGWCRIDLVDTVTTREGPGGLMEHRLRPLVYPHTDVVVIAYSVADLASLEHVVQKWRPEIRKWLPHAPLVLLGLKSDARRPLPTVGGGGGGGGGGEIGSATCCSLDRIEATKRSVGADACMECSCRATEPSQRQHHGVGATGVTVVSDVLEVVAQLGLRHAAEKEQKRQRRAKGCSVQ